MYKGGMICASRTTELMVENIQVLGFRGCSCVRNVYRSTGITGFTILWEIVDNAVDSALRRMPEISVTVEKDNSITVEDNGRGIQ